MNKKLQAIPSPISEPALEQIVGGRASDEQFEQGVKYFLETGTSGLSAMTKPAFYRIYGPRLTELGLTTRGEMLDAAHEAIKRSKA